jgi:hypothetical protein
MERDRRNARGAGPPPRRSRSRLRAEGGLGQIAAIGLAALAVAVLGLAKGPLTGSFRDSALGTLDGPVHSASVSGNPVTVAVRLVRALWAKWKRYREAAARRRFERRFRAEEDKVRRLEERIARDAARRLDEAGRGVRAEVERLLPDIERRRAALELAGDHEGAQLLGTMAANLRRLLADIERRR